MNGSEIVGEWQGKQVSVKVAGRGTLVKGEVMRSDEIGLLVAVEGWTDVLPRGPIQFGPGEDSHPLIVFIPWTQVELIVPNPGELP